MESNGLREQALAKIEATEHTLAQSLESSKELQGQVDTLGKKCSLLKKDLGGKEAEHQKKLESLESQMKEHLSNTEALNRQLLSKEEELDNNRTELENMREDLHSKSMSAKDSEELLRSMGVKEGELSEALQKLSVAESELAQGRNSTHLINITKFITYFYPVSHAVMWRGFSDYFREFPCPAWAVASFSGGPQARGTP